MKNKNDKFITNEVMRDFEVWLCEREFAANTIRKYVADTNKLMDFANGGALTKELLREYKEHLIEKNYSVNSINSFIAAANILLKFIDRSDLALKQLKQQKEAFANEDRQLSRREYMRLVAAARKKGNIRLSLILITICSTGIRISELEYLTADAVKKGRMTVFNKGKHRVVIIPDNLKKSLRFYMIQKKIKKGAVFCTSRGNPVNRSNVWREMKALCKNAGVNESKVFPHNLRHLFARLFYSFDRDIAKLADILGHSSIETTRIYLRKTAKDYMKNLSKMGVIVNLFGNGGEWGDTT